MAGGGSSSSLSAVNFPDPREVNTEVGESSSGRPPRPRTRPPPPSSRVNLTLDMAVLYEIKHGDLDPNMETKKLRRIVSNRLAAQRSRMRRSRRVMELEAKTEGLEGLIKNLAPQVESLRRAKQLMQEESDSLRAALRIREEQCKISERVQNELEAELARLKEGLENLNMNMNNQMQQIQIGEDEQDEAGVDQYLNLDDEVMLNLDSIPTFD